MDCTACCGVRKRAPTRGVTISVKLPQSDVRTGAPASIHALPRAGDLALRTARSLLAGHGVLWTENFAIYRFGDYAITGAEAATVSGDAR